MAQKNMPLIGIGRCMARLFKATVLDDIWPEILFFTSIAVVICVASDKTQQSLGISNVLLAVMGSVIVLQTVLSFRTSSASERYQEGRELWASLLANARNLAQTIWIHIPNSRETRDGETKGEMEGILEKRSIINLIQALVVSVKHFVRNEPGFHYEDLYPLLCWLPPFSSSSLDNQNRFKFGFNPHSITLLNEPRPSRVHPHRSISSSPRLNGGRNSSSDVRSDLEISGKPILQAAAADTNGGATPMTESPILENFGNFPNHSEHCLSSESTDLTSSNYPALTRRPRPSSSKQDPESYRRSSHGLNPDPPTLPVPDPNSDYNETVGLIYPPRPRLVRFHNSDALVDPSLDQSYSKKVEPDLERAIPPPPGSYNSFDSYLHNDESPRFYPDQSTYDRILPHVTHPQLKPAADPPPEALSDVFPSWRFLVWISRWIRMIATWNFEQEVPATRRKRNPYDIVENRLPLQISLVLSSYLSYLDNKRLIPASTIGTNITNSILNLQHIIAQLERLTNSPLPFAYQAHIRMCIWLYLLFLPFQVYDEFGYLTIPVTAFTTFMLVGFMEIGEELENPFDYDHNDLNLDQFCLQLQRELHQITAQIHLDPPSVIFSSRNYPLAPADWRTAEALITEGAYLGPGDQGDHVFAIKQTMLGCWKEVNQTTREWV